MHFQLIQVILASLPLAFCNGIEEVLSTSNVQALDIRAAEPGMIVEIPPSPETPYFMITGFDGFIPSPEYSSNFSRAVFNIRLMHPDENKRWTTRCFAHVRGELCDPDRFTACMPVISEENGRENVSFSFAKAFSRINILRQWEHTGVPLSIAASEPANWVRKASKDDLTGNLTVGKMGNWYERPEAWQFAWKQMANPEEQRT